LTLTETQRLAQIRADNEQWRAVTKDAENWDVTLVLKALDEKNRK
jgi:hypothetical protein